MATRRKAPKKADPTLAPYAMALLWTCTSCGFVLEGGQPHMECPSCEGYKTGFINIPQHIEVQVRSELDKNQHFNHTAARTRRLAMMQEAGVFEKFLVKGRFLP